jgi:hypothetical protein
MALDYKLEYVYDNSTPWDSSVFIHLRFNTPVYQDHINKEDYDILPVEKKHEFLTGLFNIAGVTELSTKAYRIWLMKSPVYSWQEVLEPVLYYLLFWYQESEFNKLPGSANTDGTGLTLEGPVNRRKI